jgi:vacuolar-type H+-ATPase subunit E/Vma4
MLLLNLHLALAGGDEDLESCTGGISVCSANGTIVCLNTFDARLDIAYQVLIVPWHRF